MAPIYCIMHSCDSHNRDGFCSNARDKVVAQIQRLRGARKALVRSLKSAVRLSTAGCAAAGNFPANVKESCRKLLARKLTGIRQQEWVVHTPARLESLWCETDCGNLFFSPDGLQRMGGRERGKVTDDGVFLWRPRSEGAHLLPAAAAAAEMRVPLFAAATLQSGGIPASLGWFECEPQSITSSNQVFQPATGTFCSIELAKLALSVARQLLLPPPLHM